MREGGGGVLVHKQPGLAGQVGARQGMAGLGGARQGLPPSRRIGLVVGLSGVAWLGMAWLGAARQGKTRNLPEPTPG